MGFTKIDIMFNQTDHYGNVLVADEIQEGLYAIRLKQADEARYRELGQLQEMEEGFRYMKMEKEEDKLYKTKAWSIHAKILGFCTEVVYVTDVARYSITAKKAKAVGTLASYENTSNTTKAIVPIRHWTIEWNDQKQEKLLYRLGYEWFDELKGEFDKPYMQQLGTFVSQRRKQVTVYPGRGEMFKAFQTTPFMDVKVVILGQEPYNDGSANGLAFAINNGTIPVPRSLENINRELENDVHDGFSLFKRTSLEEWTSQGVLMLNSCLSVEAGKPTSHSRIGWQKFTASAIKALVNRPGKPLVFILWGNPVIDTLRPYLQDTKHLILSASDPSLVKPSDFFGCKHFT
ncbi:MAG TPA: uracil-DNA glycosylase, partial [Prolixibacteraceae bacterium]|nr:uracil-DNA glycosylase [Prolixibacteraceae bacterium]